MPDSAAQRNNPLYWPLAELTAAYRHRNLSPVEVLELALARIDVIGPQLNVFLGRTDELARQQAEAAEAAYRAGDAGPLCGVPLSIKDTFQIAGHVTTFGSLAYRDAVSAKDCGVVRRLRAAGAVFTGRTNTAEFGQSATTENRFHADVCNPWDASRTCGGSSGGAAASVLAGLSTIALGADGGGSIRIPAAFTGLVGLKPSFGLCNNEGGLPAMSDFVCAGPIGWHIADLRQMLSVLAEKKIDRSAVPAKRRIAWCLHPEDRPVDPDVAAATGAAVERLAVLGHDIDEYDIPMAGWDQIFGPLVLEEEGRQRGHLLDIADSLTDYERKSLQAAERLTAADVDAARGKMQQYRQHIQCMFDEYDFVLTPTTAVTPFQIGNPPRQINGQCVSRTWGAYPFTAAFNVSGNPAISLPCGFADGLPVGLQLVAPMHADADLLDIAEDMHEILRYDRHPIIDRWTLPPAGSLHEAVL